MGRKYRTQGELHHHFDAADAREYAEHRLTIADQRLQIAD
jgi:hypothetical protein